MHAMHPLERRVVERLDAKGDPVDARAPPRLRNRGSHIVRIGLECDLGVASELDALVEQADESRDAISAEVGWRPAAEVERFHWPRAAARKAHRQLALHAREKLVHRHDLPDRDRKVAVAAPSRAERDVEVDMGGWQR